MSESASAGADPKPSSPLGTFLRLGISLGLLAWLVSRPDTREALGALRGASAASWVLLAALWYAGCQVLNAYKWDVILRAMGYVVPLRALIRAGFVGQFASRFLPTSIGGDLVRVIVVGQEGLPYSVGVLSAFLGRLTGLVAMLLLGLIGSLAAHSASDDVSRPILLGIAVLCGVAVVAAVVGTWVELRFAISGRLPIKLGRPLRRLADGLHALQRAPVALAWIMVISVVFQLMQVGINATVGVPAGLRLSVVDWFWYNAGVTLGGMLPTFGGLGARELVAQRLLRPVGLDTAGLVCSLLWQLAVVAASLPGGLWWVGVRRGIAKPAPSDEPGA